MRLERIDLVVVGADRIAANGDVANKIGTYTVAVLAKEHGIPFYVAAPLSTIDLARPTARGIPIEERNGREVTHVGAAAADAGGRAHPQPGVRRDARALRDRHRHRARHRPRALRRVAGGSQGRTALRLDARLPNLNLNLPMIILGIETSCDETAAAVVEETGDAARPWRVCSNVVASQVDIHREWGGVVPELSARQHVRDICGVVEKARRRRGVAALRRDCRHAGARPRGVAPRRVSASPRRWRGLAACRWCRCTTWRATSSRWCWRAARCRCPPSCWWCRAGTPACIACRAPASSSAWAARATTRRARPTTRWRGSSASAIRAGPSSTVWPAQGNDRAVPLPRTRLTHADRNAPHLPGTQRLQLQRAQDVGACGTSSSAGALLGLSPDDPLPPPDVADLCASFQRVVVETLLDRLFDEARAHGARSVGIAGGVSANSRLREDATARGAALGAARVHPAAGAVHRQRRDDCGRRPARVSRRRRGGRRSTPTPACRWRPR